jgi:hypothetical protein
MVSDKRGAASAQAETSNRTRPVDLAGDSPELVAFALLRYLAQVEQAAVPKPQFDREWLLDAYAVCLDAVKGLRSDESRSASSKGKAAGGSNSASPRRASQR